MFPEEVSLKCWQERRSHRLIHRVVLDDLIAQETIRYQKHILLRNLACESVSLTGRCIFQPGHPNHV